jgi:uncharacterized protein YyaL (SSP411 family)
VVRARHRPHLVLAGGRPGEDVPELLADRSTVDGWPTAYVCEGFTCRRPVTDAHALTTQL